MNRLFFLHTHYIPKAIIDGSSFVGAVIVPEFYADLNKSYWGMEKSYSNIVEYLYDRDLTGSTGTKIVFGIENINMITHVNILPFLKRHGVEVIQIYHNKDNRFFSLKNGLSEEGLKLLKFMEEADLILDLSHVPDEQIYGIMNVYSGKIIVSHCACSDLYKYDLRRSNSLRKSTLEYLAGKNILIGLAFINDIIAALPYTVEENDDTLLNDLAEQIYYIGSITGASKLALGPDFIDLEYFSKVFNVNLKISSYLYSGYGYDKLIQILLKKGLTKDEINGILYGNAWNFLEICCEA